MVFWRKKQALPKSLEEAVNQGSQILAEPFRKALETTANGAYQVGIQETTEKMNQMIAKINETHSKQISALQNEYMSYRGNVNETLKNIQAQKQQLTQTYTQVMETMDQLINSLLQEGKGKK
ncbi:MAG: hypothetical protein OH319_02975 [Candidatus Parvarchaeota archaeon]|nr:hypothetical protein [Candidatus Jingweiarchaeum tengchongense]MCW1298332.1 hypothetical protein [Candidatus Jingweiarchaeum tengchongense]MCW1304732.1 hypothetical protein [Candidatus Jingweiarchaeum tengchongense]MCW1306167.1 hypothetical protein [Candidatus Jingweiarchaeum tengchongense]MCW1310569.1 hypothetical protein [Candidatus Jingweiarchaeum tengchongense]